MILIAQITDFVSQTLKLQVSQDENTLADSLYSVANICDNIPQIQKYANDIRFLSDRIILTQYEIKSVRRRLGLSQSQFGLRVNDKFTNGGAQSFVSNLENGNVKPSVEILEKIRFLREESKNCKELKVAHPKMEQLINRVNPKTGKRFNQVDIARFLKLTRQGVNRLMYRDTLGKHEKTVDTILSQYPIHDIKTRA